jgi:hypothetical protein
MDSPLIPPSPIIILCRRDFVEEHRGAFAGHIFPGGLVWPLIFGLLLICIHSVMVLERFSTENTLMVQQ